MDNTNLGKESLTQLPYKGAAFGFLGALSLAFLYSLLLGFFGILISQDPSGFIIGIVAAVIGIIPASIVGAVCGWTTSSLIVFFRPKSQELACKIGGAVSLTGVLVIGSFLAISNVFGSLLILGIFLLIPILLCIFMGIWLGQRTYKNILLLPNENTNEPANLNQKVNLYIAGTLLAIGIYLILNILPIVRR